MPPIKPSDLQGTIPNNKIIKKVDSNNFGSAIADDIVVMGFPVPEFKYDGENKITVSEPFPFSGRQSGNILKKTYTINKDGIYGIKIVVNGNSGSIPYIEIKNNGVSVFNGQGNIKEPVYANIGEVKSTDVLEIWSPFKQDTFNDVTITFVTSVIYNTIT